MKCIILAIACTLIACSSSAQEVRKMFYKDSDIAYLEIITDASQKETWKEYYQSGKLRRISTKSPGHDGAMMDGDDITYFENGKIAGFRHWNKGISDGREYTVYENGHLAVERFYKDGFKFGTWKFYNKDGTLKKEQIFKENISGWTDETELALNKYYWKGKLAYTEEVIDDKTKIRKIVDQSTYDQLIAGNPPSGTELFKQTCAACHAAKIDFIGPRMQGVTERRSAEWLYKMITNGDDLVKSGDTTAIALYNKWHVPHHPNYQLLDKAQVDAIIKYLKTL
jgi:antitoxin component YwqK of YwqJK toxin-antitoxin module